MSKNITYTGIGLYNILTPNKNASLTFTGGNTVVEVLDHAIWNNRTPGALATISGILNQTSYRLIVNGYSESSSIQAHLWAGHTRSNQNSVVPMKLLSVGTATTISGQFATNYSGTVDVGVLIREAHMGDRFTIVSLMLQEIRTDYIIPFSEVKTVATFETINITSDLIIAGVGLDNQLIDAVVATDVAIASDIQAIMTTDSVVTSDLSLLTTEMIALQSDIAGLIATDANIFGEFGGLSATDLSLLTELTTLFIVVGSDFATNGSVVISDLTVQLNQINSDISAIWTTDQSLVDYINGLQLTDVALAALLSAVLTTDISFNSELSALRTTDISLSNQISSISTTDLAINLRLNQFSSDIAGLRTTDTSILATITSAISELVQTDAALISDISAIITSDLFISGLIASVVSDNRSSISDIEYLWSLQAQLLVGGNLDLNGLLVTDAYLCTVLTGVVASDTYLQALMTGIKNSDSSIITGIPALTSDISALRTTDISLNLLIVPLNSEINAIQTTDANILSRIIANVSDITAIQTTDSIFNTTSSDISAIRTTDISLVNLLTAIAATDISIMSDIQAIWTTDTYISNALVAIWTTDAYIYSVGSGTGQTPSDLAAFRATDASMITSIGGIWATDAAINSDLSAIFVSDIAVTIMNDPTFNMKLDYFNSEYDWVNTFSLPTYSGSTTYTTGQKVFYNGHAYQATSTTTGVQPIDYLFYDDFSYFCDSTPLVSGFYGYEVSDNFTSDFLLLGPVVSTSGTTAIVTTSIPRAFTIELGTTTMYVDLLFSSLPDYTSDQPWICMRTAANGPLSFQAGNNTAAVGSTSIFTVGSKGGILTGGATAAAVISGSTYTPPVSGDILRIGRSTNAVTLQVNHGGSFGGLATITLTGATFTSASTNLSIGLGFAGTYTLNSIASYVNATSEAAKPWSLITQPASRQLVTSDTLTLNARYGKFFWSPGSIASGSSTNAMTWNNIHISPHSHLDLQIVQWGVTAAVANASLRVDVVSQGQGKAKLQLSNTGGAAVLPFATIVFYVRYPLALI